MRWIIGDIHGMLKPLDALLAAVAALDPSPRFMFTGDYVNRGPDSAGVIDRLLGLPGAKFVRGNHDDIVDFILNGSSYICQSDSSDRKDAAAAFTWFMNHGLEATLRSYGISGAAIEAVAVAPTAKSLGRLAEAVPASHRRFLHELPPVLEQDDLFMAHALWNPEEPEPRGRLAARLAEEPSLRYQLLWGRYTGEQIKSKKRWKRTGYFGHTPVFNYADPNARPVPLHGPKIVLLDTAAALGPTGRLSAACADTGQVIQARPDGHLVDVEEG